LASVGTIRFSISCMLNGVISYMNFQRKTVDILKLLFMAAKSTKYSLSRQHLFVMV
jgi:uncharacterized protein YciW